MKAALSVVVVVAWVVSCGGQQVEWVRTARFKDNSYDLLKEMPPLQMEPMETHDGSHMLEIDRSKMYQELVGFGGAFTEASAINWRRLSKEDQDKVIKLYFASPEEGGHGYTLGRVPINSCDFSPASYNFDDVAGDTTLEHFDTAVTHDVEVGMIPMILQAQETVNKRGLTLNVYASPWSPPAWMKLPAWKQQSMVLSASPNGLMPSMQRSWALYFSKFIEAYKGHGIKLWGVTVQNEPEASVGWEACLWTPDYMAQFVKNHLGPVLQEDHPEVKIIGFDHNKDHVAIWAKELYADPEAAKFFYGIGVHWYGGLNTQNLNHTHHLAPNKVILGTEACNCGGVVYREPVLATWWSRAESLALDMLEDLRFWAVGWTDWNLLLDTKGGPNHLKNLCDANIIVDPDEALGMGKLIMQASYYYMGHFSRYLLPGSKRIDLRNSVEIAAPPLEPGDVKNGQAVLFAPCDGNDVQKWQLDDAGALLVRGTNEAEGSEGFNHGGECVDVDGTSWIEGRLQVWACAHTPNQEWAVRTVAGGSQVYNPSSGKCLTAVRTPGTAVGLDAGVTITAAQLQPCLNAGDPSQTFVLANYDAQGFPDNFPVRTLQGAPGGSELCLQPQIVRVPHFDAVAFSQPDGSISLVAMNIGDNPVEFSLRDKVSKRGIRHLTLGPHAIHTYRWMPLPQTASAAQVEPAAASEQPQATPAGVDVARTVTAMGGSSAAQATPHDRTGAVTSVSAFEREPIDARTSTADAWASGAAGRDEAVHSASAPQMLVATAATAPPSRAGGSLTLLAGSLALVVAVVGMGSRWYAAQCRAPEVWQPADETWQDHGAALQEYLAWDEDAPLRESTHPATVACEVYQPMTIA